MLKKFESQGKIIIRDRRTFIDKYAKKDDESLSSTFGKKYFFIVQEGDKFILMTAHPSDYPEE